MRGAGGKAQTRGGAPHPGPFPASGKREPAAANGNAFSHVLSRMSAGFLPLQDEEQARRRDARFPPLVYYAKTA